MIFRQVIHEDLGCASYFVGDPAAGLAAVVDPQLAIAPYLSLARHFDVAIAHVLETHVHADHVSGRARLVVATGAVAHVHRTAGVSYAHEPFEDGWELQLGRLRVRALHLPGHRPEHTGFLLADDARADGEPWALLSGDSVFVGDVARPDLAIEAGAGARALFRSLHERVLTLPAHVELWPGHLGGSLCGGGAMSLKTCSTVGFESRHNWALALGEEDAFVAGLTTELAPQPPNFEAVVALNRGAGLPPRELRPLTPAELAQREQAGALVVDVRSDAEFDEAHVPGAICLPLRGAGFGSRLAWATAGADEVLVVGRDDADGEQAVALAEPVGVQALAGYLSGGMTSWREQRRATASVERVSVTDLHARWSAERLQILDVRERADWRRERIPGSLQAAYRDLDKLPDGLDARRPVATVCHSGRRSGIAASLLRRLGVEDVIHVADGGVATWRERGWPLEAGCACPPSG